MIGFIIQTIKKELAAIKSYEKFDRKYLRAIFDFIVTKFPFK